MNIDLHTHNTNLRRKKKQRQKIVILHCSTQFRCESFIFTLRKHHTMKIVYLKAFQDIHT